MNKLSFVSVNGEKLYLPAGPAGPDGNPIGTILSYMGTKAPDGYLVCDGSIETIAAYPDLADFFKEQFGSVNYFGGNGTTTFAVPDMRNLFLRGYRGSAEALSNNIGKLQPATRHLYTNLNSGRYLINENVNGGSLNVDSSSGYGKFVSVNTSSSTISGSEYYTSHPVNMAVLYCIKATVSGGAASSGVEELVQDGWYIRKWNDGYIEMLKSQTRTVTINQLEGSLYFSTFVSALKYPVPLTECYYENVSAVSNNMIWTAYFRSNGSAGNNLDKLTTSLAFRCASATSIGSAGITIYYYVSGRWKSSASLASTPTIIPEFPEIEEAHASDAYDPS